jgi:putative autoinducer-2 (AI-2) aldolase
MPDAQEVVKESGGINPEKEFHLNIPPLKMGFHVKGMDNADWGMKERLSHIFNPKSGNALMFAFDHGYIMGASTGLERLDILIPQLAEDIDVFMATRGALRTFVPPTYRKGIALRCSAGSTAPPAA